MALTTGSGIIASIAPFDPTIGIAAVATIMLALVILAMVSLAVMPLISTGWAERLGVASSRRSSLTTEEAD